LGPTAAEATEKERKVGAAASTPGVIKTRMDRSGAEGTTRRGEIESEASARTGALEDKASAEPNQAPPQRTEESQERRRGRGGQATDKDSQAGNEAATCA
ncbi:MAG: hypothetical protein ACREQ3_12155, partial [Candidatus Binatia bacterium]